jgi:hypothetical protein
MIKKLKPTVFFLIQFLFLQGVYGQIQSNFPDSLGLKFLRFCKSVPREEIFIHSDREEYISGEDMWFNIYLIDRQSFKPTNNSKIAYFELLNPDNRPVVQKKIWLNGGFGKGQVALPDTLSSGYYTIRVYTSWMKNFLPDNCFVKGIHVYNSFSNKTFETVLKSEKRIVPETGENGIPVISNTGLILKVDNLKPDILEINVSTNEKFRSENNNQFFLFVHTHGIINMVSSEKITGEITKVVFPKNKLIAGINCITVFNLKGQPVAERFIHTPEEKKVRLSVHSADSAGFRNKISLDLDLEKGSPDINPANFSISVAPETTNSSFDDLSDYMIFGTEFGPSPLGVFKNKMVDELAPESLDSLLLSAKSNWINWRMILADSLPDFKYQIENEDHYLYGNLAAAGKSDEPDRFIVLSSPGKTAGFQYSKTDNKGNFRFRLHIDEKVKDLIIQPDIINNNQLISVESSFSDQYLKSEKSADSVNKTVPQYISNWSVNNQVRKIYGTSFAGEPYAPVIQQPKIVRFYGKPDQELIMKDYITLPVMQEVFFELLVGVFLKNKKSGYEITIPNPENYKSYETPSGLFIDGVMIKDAAKIASLDPENVEKIDIIREKYYVGDYLFFGIVNVITKTGDFSFATLPDNAIRMHYSAVDSTGSFLSPDYTSAELKKSRIPDFRNTLYWNPSVKPDKDGKARVEFWTSDFASDFVINIQGFTPEGIMISAKKIIKVKR